ncbi:MAG: hypothetical protein E7Z80_02610 [Methanobrevibacter thaueri]|nr:hypothetical protein [Methanobrevibacter thaueri]
MNNKILKGSIIAIILIVFLIFIASSVTSAEAKKSNDTTIETLSKGGLVIKYPSDWGYSKANSNYSIMSISKLSSIDSKGVGQININCEKKPIEGDFVTFVNSTYKALDSSSSSFEMVSSGESMIGDRKALEYIYVSNDTGDEREHKAIWFEKGGQAYVLLYSAPLDKFESNMYVFNYVLSEIKIT